MNEVSAGSDEPTRYPCRRFLSRDVTSFWRVSQHVDPFQGKNPAKERIFWQLSLLSKSVLWMMVDFNMAVRTC
jgi:hypothetical protein